MLLKESYELHFVLIYTEMFPAQKIAHYLKILNEYNDYDFFNVFK